MSFLTRTLRWVPWLCLVGGISLPTQVHASFSVLIFSRTAAFRHDSIPTAVQALQGLAAQHGFQATATEDPAAFTDASLARFNAVVFLLTTGDVLDATQQAAFERFIRQGGGYVGVHSASDTEYSWPWYGDLVGAYFKSHPRIQSATVRVVDPVHPSTAGLPRRWVRTDEWYSFMTNPRGKAHILATVDERTYSPGDAMGHDHPVAWCHEFEGGRAWYTAGGHSSEAYSEPLFLDHLLGGMRWAARQAPGDAGATLERNFQRVTLDPAPQDAMELAVTGEGRVIYIERGGRVKIWKPDTQSVVEAGRLDVTTVFEDGLLGIALDPGFSSNHWLYLFYSPAGTVPEQRLSRFELHDDHLAPASERILLRVGTQRDQCCHSGGSLKFGPDGTLYLSTGDNTNPFESAGFSPHDERPGRSAWDAQKSSSNPNDLRGKILRIRPLTDGTYAIPAGNLFPPGTPGTRPEIYIMGARNPFRIGIDPVRGWLYWGEVGPDARGADPQRGPAGMDEWNQARAAGNHGWPYFLANNIPYHRYNFATGVGEGVYDPLAPTNPSPNNTGRMDLPPAVPAWIWYASDTPGSFPEIDVGRPRTAMGGPVYKYEPGNPSTRKLPAYYDQTVFIYEWSRNFIKEVKLDENGDLLAIQPFLPSLKLSRPIEMEIGPDGAIYLIEWGTGFNGTNPDARVVRIDYTAGNRPPTARITASSLSGSIPLEVAFSATDSDDPEGDDLRYAWSFQGGGTVDSTDPAPRFTYTSPGNYIVRLTVTDSAGDTGVTEARIVAGNTPPQITISRPPNGAFFDWGETIEFELTGTDHEENGIPCDQIRVDPLLGHDDHSHGLGRFIGCSGEFRAPDAEDADTDRLFLLLQANTTDHGNPPADPLEGRTTHLLNPRLKQAEHFTRTQGMAMLPTADAWGGGSDLATSATPNSSRGFAFRPVSLRSVSAVMLRVSNTSTSGVVEIRQGGANGPILGVSAIPLTGDRYQELRVPISGGELSGEVFFVFQSATEDAGQIRVNWVYFESDQASSNPVVLEAAEAPQGPYRRLSPAQWHADLKRFTVDRPLLTSFFRVVADTPVRVRSIETEGVKLRIWLAE